MRYNKIKNKKQTIIKPYFGWKPLTYYVVDVAFNEFNPVHRIIFYSGFLDKDNNPAGYNELYSDDRCSIDDVYYMRVIKTIGEFEYEYKNADNEIERWSNKLKS